MIAKVLALAGLDLPLPEGWRLDHQASHADSAELVFVFALPDEQKALPVGKPPAQFMGSALVELANHGKHVDLEEFVAERCARFERAQPTCRQMHESASTIAGVRSVVREHIFAGPGRMLYRQKLIYAAFERRTWVFSTTHLAGRSFDEARKAFDAFISNISRSKRVNDGTHQ